MFPEGRHPGSVRRRLSSKDELVVVGIERNPAEARVGNRELRVWRLTKKSENLRRRTGDDTERFASLVGDDKPNIRLIPDPLLHKAQAILLVSDARDDRVESFPPPQCGRGRRRSGRPVDRRMPQRRARPERSTSGKPRLGRTRNPRSRRSQEERKSGVVAGWLIEDWQTRLGAPRPKMPAPTPFSGGGRYRRHNELVRRREANNGIRATRKPATCAECGVAASVNVRIYCMSRPERFGGAVYCYTHQRYVR